MPLTERQAGVPRRRCGDYVDRRRRRRPGRTRRAPSRSRPATRRPNHGSRRPTSRTTASPPRAARTAGRASRPGHAGDGTTFELDHGAVVIAAITSCTNTSNPQVMIGAALLAKNAVERGLTRKPWVKTTLAPGLQGGHGLLRAGRPDAVPGQARLQPGRLRLHHLHRQLRPAAGGGLAPRSTRHDLAVVSVLSGNRNFEGRINPDVKMNYLASPPLVVAYALAGTMDIDLANEPLGTGHRRPAGLPARHLADAARDRRTSSPRRSARRCSRRDYADVFAGDERWQSLPTPTGDTFAWDADSTYVRKPPYFEGMAAASRRRSPTSPAPGCWPSSATRSPPTTSRPAGSIKADSPAGRYLAEHGVDRQGLQLLRLAPRQPRGDDPRHLRQHPAAQPARARASRAASPSTTSPASRPPSTTPRGATRRPACRWSSWPARSTAPARRATGRPRAPMLLGVRAVIAESLRAHPPLQPDRHGRAAAAVPGRPDRRVARA